MAGAFEAIKSGACRGTTDNCDLSFDTVKRSREEGTAAIMFPYHAAIREIPRRQDCGRDICEFKPN